VLTRSHLSAILLGDQRRDVQRQPIPIPSTARLAPHTLCTTYPLRSPTITPSQRIPPPVVHKSACFARASAHENRPRLCRNPSIHVAGSQIAVAKPPDDRRKRGQNGSRFSKTTGKTGAIWLRSVILPVAETQPAPTPITPSRPSLTHPAIPVLSLQVL
jgi:hypothetical protein